jgi:hypothetical protein
MLIGVHVGKRTRIDRDCSVRHVSQKAARREVGGAGQAAIEMRRDHIQPSLRAAPLAPRSNSEFAVWILDCGARHRAGQGPDPVGTKEAPRHDRRKHLFLDLS